MHYRIISFKSLHLWFQNLKKSVKNRKKRLVLFEKILKDFSVLFFHIQATTGPN